MKLNLILILAILSFCSGEIQEKLSEEIFKAKIDGNFKALENLNNVEGLLNKNSTKRFFWMSPKFCSKLFGPSKNCKNKISGRIFEGDLSESDDFPYQALINMRSFPQRYSQHTCFFVHISSKFRGAKN